MQKHIVCMQMSIYCVKGQSDFKMSFLLQQIESHQQAVLCSWMFEHALVLGTDCACVLVYAHLCFCVDTFFFTQ